MLGLSAIAETMLIIDSGTAGGSSGIDVVTERALQAIGSAVTTIAVLTISRVAKRIARDLLIVG